MELREFALNILHAGELETKLRPPTEELRDDVPGPSIRFEAPARVEALKILPGRQVKVPALLGMGDPAQRPRILHALANHELQACELFAWALLAFPDADPEFRQGLFKILLDEQRHTRMYVARLKAYGVRFGDVPVSGYFWNKVDSLTSPLHFICAMSLTFENANLDHTVDLAEACRKAGDPKTARVIDRVHQDEIEHVRFGWHWLQRFKNEDQSAWQAYRDSLTWPLRPAKARGRKFYYSGRQAAGLDADFIRRLEEAES